MFIIKNISIKHFNSIENINISIDEIDNKRCVILAGLNETGKSNIINAIANFENDSSSLEVDLGSSSFQMD